MNDRIKQLAKEAGMWRQHYDIGEESPAGLEKFAELIVRECIEVALNERVAEEEIDKSDDIEDRCYLRGNNGGIVDAVVAIKQHFGVEW